MSLNNILKRALIGFQHRLMSHESVHRSLADLANQANSTIPRVANHKSPYGSSEISGGASREDVVFVTSRFRSGSTFLWNIFRQTGGFTAYYEPFNERRWFDESFRGDNVDSTHRGVDDYWSEYNGLSELHPLYNEDWIRHRLLMEGREYDPAMRAYIECLVDRAPHRPILQFNRIDFRLGWIRANFPNAKILHLYRHPRDQWCSFLTDINLMNKDAAAKTYVDGFYLNLWCDDLAIHFPFLDRRKTPHPYQQFYYLWKLSYLFGKHYSDYSFSFENLTQKTELVLGNMFSIIGVDNPPIEMLCGLVHTPKPDKWRDYADSDWFDQFETECEHQLDIFFASQRVK